jgi:glycosyltransferase involved in cell wall biosynthesis
MSISLNKTTIPDLSVILPALRADAEFMRCVWAIRAACANKISFEIVSVVKNLESFNGLATVDLRIVPEEHPGIYAAMNTGLGKAIGLYVYFIGQDDILLPTVVDSILKASLKRVDLIIADVFWGTRRLYKNSKSPRSLIWRNWCHQGIVYRREFLRESGVSFQEEFRTQSDHYFNIVLTASHRASIMKVRNCIAWYSAEGISSSYKDSAFRARFPSLIRENFGLISYLIVVFRRAILRVFRTVIHQ